ncbi:MAG TPA: 50S ribosomal protein L11 methyltransferase [Steroidobacteraceae bacterium]|jgi:ribosomal protein L11 methyltransferase|nr:50S ribosomal protein L11 methyltransferase [Steroidobacteraceae bacterium]
MTFYEIEFPLATLRVEEVEAALLEIGAGSITFVDRGDEPVLEPKPGEMRLWGDTLVRALFQETSDAGSSAKARNLERLAAALGPHITMTARVRAVEDRDWERVWLADWKSMRFGRRLWVCPTAADPPDDPNAVVVRLDPGLAFGTGTHPTTALCLQILDALPVSGRRVIDYGCGSGILGIAALKLGATHVTAVDLDPQALLATRDNAIRNGVSSGIDVQDVEGEGIDGGLRQAYCVMANILAGPLIELAPKLTAACEPGGYLLLSGLLKTQAYAVKAAYASAFDKVQVVERDDWCCIYARRSA